MNSRNILEKIAQPIIDNDVIADAVTECQVKIGEIEQGNIDLEQQIAAIRSRIDERMHDLERAQRRAHTLETSIMLALATLRDPKVQIHERNINAQFYLEAALGKK
jgi:hypothetical protein